jgi:hypothetical protein
MVGTKNGAPGRFFSRSAHPRACLWPIIHGRNRQISCARERATVTAIVPVMRLETTNNVINVTQERRIRRAIRCSNASSSAFRSINTTRTTGIGPQEFQLRFRVGVRRAYGETASFPVAGHLVHPLASARRLTPFAPGRECYGQTDVGGNQEVGDKGNVVNVPSES